MAQSGHRDATAEIEVALAIGGIEVHPLALVEGKVGPGISGHDGRYHRNCSPALTAAVKTASRQGKRPSILIGMEGVNVSWD